MTMWLSVDPMADKYPNVSSYAYCTWNPIVFIDPDGQRKWPIDKEYNGASRVIVSGMYRNNNGALHKGVDIAHRPPAGSPNLEGGTIYATHDGVVVISNTSKTAGNWIVIRNGDVQTKYMHMQDVSDFKVGDYVMEGAPIGTVGTTGHSEGPHVHYQIEVFDPENNNWKPVNPVEGDVRQVTYKMEVDLKDVQAIIDHRDDILQRIILQEVTITNTVEK